MDRKGSGPGSIDDSNFRFLELLEEEEGSAGFYTVVSWSLRSIGKAVGAAGGTRTLKRLSKLAIFCLRV